MKTEKESFQETKQDLFLFEKFLNQQQIPIQFLDEYLPGIIHINKIEDVSIQFLNEKGCEMYQHSFSEIQTMGNEIFEKYTHPDTIENEFPKFAGFLEHSDGHSVGSLFQRVRFYQKKEHEWVYTTFKKLRGTDCWIGLSHTINEMGPMGRKFKNVLDENYFLRKNFNKFSSLTNREKEVLGLIALGHTNKSIADQLFISEHTVRTHRNHIWSKLDIKHLREAIKYAEVYDLV